MRMNSFPVIDLSATGSNIQRLRVERGLTVRDLQRYFGFEEPRAIYKWQKGESLPTVDNLYALSRLLQVPMEAILVPQEPRYLKKGQQEYPCCLSLFSRFRLFCVRQSETRSAMLTSVRLLDHDPYIGPSNHISFHRLTLDRNVILSEAVWSDSDKRVSRISDARCRKRRALLRHFLVVDRFVTNPGYAALSFICT